MTARSRYRPASSRSDSPASICCDSPAAIASRYPSGRDLTRDSGFPSSKARAGRNSGVHGQFGRRARDDDTVTDPGPRPVSVAGYRVAGEEAGESVSYGGGVLRVQEMGEAGQVEWFGVGQPV